jgi:hypothetical protein
VGPRADLDSSEKRKNNKSKSSPGYWVLGLCPSSDVLLKNNVSETGSVNFLFRRITCQLTEEDSIPLNPYILLSARESLCIVTTGCGL